MEILKSNVRYIKGVGPKKAAILESLGIITISDVLEYYPRDYENWDSVKKLSEAINGETSSFKVRFLNKASLKVIRGNLKIISWEVSDENCKATCIWYNQLFRKNLYKSNVDYFLRGKLEIKFGQLQILAPTVEEFDPDKHSRDKIIPVYSLVNGLSQNDLRNIIAEAINLTKGNLIELFQSDFLNDYNLVTKHFALSQIHFPTSIENYEKARRRLVFEELLYLKLALLLLRNNLSRNNTGIILDCDISKIDFLKSTLPYTLTFAQNEAIKQIIADFNSGVAMNRLLQGDVGSGKTVIALMAAYYTFCSGYQSAIMVPTEILAKQHFESFRKVLSNFNVRIECLSGSLPQISKEQIKSDLKDGKIDIVIGTHALIQEDVYFNKLGFIVTDEQHRFGVRQRALMKEKGLNPHLLVMSATPIPRTISLLFYGDLDSTIIDELPPGRKCIKTYHVTQDMRSKVYEFIKKQVDEGRQCYLVCPLIEESNELEAQSAVELFNSLGNGEFKDLKLGLLHSKMTTTEKEDVMGKFVRNFYNVLVCTTVIEVGVNVPNASVVIIENAERFGLAQLHQLRGRVGRGEHQSYCILITDAKSPEAKERMQVLVKSNSGFDIADMDLKLRGPGDFLGTRQHGIPEFKLASLAKDTEILKIIQVAADEITSKPQKHSQLIEYITEKYEKMLSGVVLS